MKPRRSCRGGNAAWTARADPLRELACADGGPDRQPKRAMVQSILGDQFGAEVTRVAKFQQVVDRVTDALEVDAEPGRLLTRMTGELRTAARH